ncbi:MAG: hypothetical protein HZC40_09780 [Chloroflexi bacterium]|nr:hypothetical protein [Chloroflexota bacterium]
MSTAEIDSRWHQEFCQLWRCWICKRTKTRAQLCYAQRADAKVIGAIGWLAPGKRNFSCARAPIFSPGMQRLYRSIFCVPRNQFVLVLIQTRDKEILVTFFIQELFRRAPNAVRHLSYRIEHISEIIACKGEAFFRSARGAKKCFALTNTLAKIFPRIQGNTDAE